MDDMSYVGAPGGDSLPRSRFSSQSGITVDGWDAVSLLPRYSMISMVESSSESTPLPEPPIYSPTSASSIASPRYSTVFTRLDPPPAVEPTATWTAHEFTLKNGRKPWAMLQVLSSAASSTNAPKYIGGEHITGSLALQLDSAQNIHAINISVRGRIITGITEEESYTFLDRAVTLWSKAVGDPRQAQLGGPPFDGKLCGDYLWPFTFPFPVEADIPGGSESLSRFYQVPQTFFDRITNATIQYDLIVNISRGRLRPDSKIQTPVIYVPKIIPDAPSPLRRLAYDDGSPLPGPLTDPEGWYTLPPMVVRGQLFRQRIVELHYKLSIAYPLCYTRGTVIPCSLDIRGFDSHTLDVLASPKAISVGLQRRVKYFPEGARQAVKRQSALKKSEVAKIETAVWWTPPGEMPQEKNERRLEGEIHLAKEIQPSSEFIAFAVEYFICFLPPSSPAFIPDNPDAGPITQPVTIGTLLTPGSPPPRKYSPVRDSARVPRHYNDVLMNHWGFSSDLSKAQGQ